MDTKHLDKNCSYKCNFPCRSFDEIKYMMKKQFSILRFNLTSILNDNHLGEKDEPDSRWRKI